MDFEDDFDDLDQILSNLPSEENVKNDEDSADELLDILMEEETPDKVKDKTNSDPGENDDSNDEGEDQGLFLYFIRNSNKKRCTGICQE